MVDTNKDNRPGPSTNQPTREQLDLRAISETSKLLSSSIDLEFVLDNLLLILMSKLLVSRAVFFLYDPLYNTYRVAAVKGLSRLKKGEQLSFPRPRHWKDIPEALQEFPFKLVVPVDFQERHIGVVALGNKVTGEDFSSDELAFIQTLVSLASTAIHNALIVEELKQANRELDARLQALNTLFDLAQEFNASLDREHRLKLLTYALMGQLLVRKFMFLLRRPSEQGVCEGESFEIVAARGVPRISIAPDLMKRLCTLAELVLLSDADDPLWMPFKKNGFVLVLPLQLQGETRGILCLGPKMTGEPYLPEDIEFLYALGTLALISIQNIYLIEELIEKERLEEEIRLAREIQERLLPRSLPCFPGLQMAAIALPSREVAGDYYDVLKLSSEQLLVAIADVTGKGVPAALLMANLQASLRALVTCQHDLRAATAKINEIMCENTDSSHFITFCWGIFERKDSLFRYVNAGHNPPYFIKADGRVKQLQKGGLLLGVLPGVSYEEGHEPFHVQDVLVLYTDGVTEAMNEAGEEYGEERFLKVLLQHRQETAEDILHAVIKDVRRFTGEAPLSDDLTLVVLKRVEEATQ